MEFKAFQATRKHVDDIQKEIGFDDGMGKRGGFVYDGTCYIEENSNKSRGAYYLLISRSDWLSDDLERLEKILWADFYLGAIASPDFVLRNPDSKDGLNDLNIFIQGYCDSRNIAVDGDAFGMIFSGRDEYTVQEATTLVEQAIRLYVLEKR